MSEEVRLWAVSDIHTDLPENEAWVRALSATDYLGDTLIVAGDVSGDEAVLERTLRVLAAKFGTVVFTLGNHDLWLSEEELAGGGSCMGKLERLLALCDALRVRTQAVRIEGGRGVAGGRRALWVCPL